MEPVQVVLHSHVKGRRDGALFLVAPHVQVAVGPAVGQAVDKPGVSMEAKHDVFIFGEKRIVIRLAQSVRVLTRRPVSYTHLRAHETDSYLVCRLLLEKKKNI